MKSRKILIAIVFSLSITACGSDSGEGSRISISWASDFARQFIDPEDDVSASVGGEPSDVREASISQQGSKKLRVAFDLFNLPSDEYLLTHQCDFNVYFESDAVHIYEVDGLETEVTVYLLAQLSSCENSVSCGLDKAKISYGIYYEYGSGTGLSLSSFTGSRSFSDFVSDNSIVFEIDSGDFGKSLSSIKQKNLTSHQELGNLFTENIVIDIDHGIRMEAECDGAYDLVPNEGFAYE